SKDLTKIIISKYFNKYIGASLILLFLSFLPQIWVKGGYDFYFIKRVLNIFLEILSGYVVYWFIKRYYKTVTLGTVLNYIVLAAIIQVIISMFFFIKPHYYDLYYSYLNEDVENKDFSEMVAMLQVRFIGVGSSFFNGINKYGIAFFAALILPHVHKGFLTSNKILYWFSVLIVFMGGMLTGRTFFIAIALGLLMITLLKSKTILGFAMQNIKFIFLFVPFLFIIYFILSALIDVHQLERVFNYVFELFLNYFSGQGLQSRSTNAQIGMYVFPDSVNTWLFGDGRMQALTGGYYMGSDIGYVRLIFYFGLPATLFFVYLLYKYFRILSGLANYKPLTYFFFTIFLWFIILNFKGLAFHSYYFSMFILVLVLTTKSKFKLKI